MARLFDLPAASIGWTANLLRSMIFENKLKSRVVPGRQYVYLMYNI
jgi:hypothetical protein